MAETLKVVVPMAGWGTRMRPHTWSKPKSLVSVAGKTSFDHLMEMFKSIPNPQNATYVFIIDSHVGAQIPPYVGQHYPDIEAHFVIQEEMKGQSHALWLAREFLNGPIIMCFSDTLMVTDFSFLSREKEDGVAWVKAVPDPRRFGVAEVNGEGLITRLIEKPQSPENNLAVVGCYYFKDGSALLSAIEEQMGQGIALRGEFFLADAITIMIKRGARICTHQIDVWLDTGTIDATLETNRYLLAHGGDNSADAAKTETVKVIPPAYVHPTAELTDSVIGPYASIGPNCKIADSRIENSILEEGVQVIAATLSNSLIGRQARVEGQPGHECPVSVNIGDNSSVRL
jgi:glucose-1-phosphate thymidylyltransferase